MVITNDYINITRDVLTNSESIFYFIKTVRDVGKTWGAKKYIWKRAIKRGRKAIVIRRTKVEAEKMAETFYASVDMQKFCGYELYNPQTKKGNLRREGKTFYVKRNGKWEWFLKITNLSQFRSLRSADDPKCNTIILEEYAVTEAEYRRYSGNEVENFIDIVYSVARQHPIRCIFLGNKESLYDPYLDYFGIKPMPAAYQGIVKYKDKTITCYYRNSKAEIKDKKGAYFHRRLETLLSGTAYGRFIEGEYKNNVKLKLAAIPEKAEGYLQLKWRDKLFRICTFNGNFYINDKPDITLLLLTDKITNSHKYKMQWQLFKREHRHIADELIYAYLQNKIYYSSEIVYHNLQPFLKWLGVINT